MTKNVKSLFYPSLFVFPNNFLITTAPLPPTWPPPVRHHVGRPIELAHNPDQHPDWTPFLAIIHSFNVIFLIVSYPSGVHHVTLDLTSSLLPTLSLALPSMPPSPTSALEPSPSSSAWMNILFAASPFFERMDTVCNVGMPWSVNIIKLGNQIAGDSTMVDLVKGMVFAQKVGLIVGH